MKQVKNLKSKEFCHCLACLGVQLGGALVRVAVFWLLEKCAARIRNGHFVVGRFYLFLVVFAVVLGRRQRAVWDARQVVVVFAYSAPILAVVGTTRLRKGPEEQRLKGRIGVPVAVPAAWLVFLFRIKVR